MVRQVDVNPGGQNPNTKQNTNFQNENAKFSGHLDIGHSVINWNLVLGACPAGIPLEEFMPIASDGGSRIGE